MKTTIELSDELFIAAKQRAVDERSTLRAIVERGLRSELRGPRAARSRPHQSAIRWVTVDGGLPKGLDLRNRATMSDWLRTRG